MSEELRHRLRVWRPLDWDEGVVPPKQTPRDQEMHVGMPIEEAPSTLQARHGSGDRRARPRCGLEEVLDRLVGQAGEPGQPFPAAVEARCALGVVKLPPDLGWTPSVPTGDWCAAQVSGRPREGIAWRLLARRARKTGGRGYAVGTPVHEFVGCTRFRANRAGDPPGRMDAGRGGSAHAVEGAAACVRRDDGAIHPPDPGRPEGGGEPETCERVRGE